MKKDNDDNFIDKLLEVFLRLKIDLFKNRNKLIILNQKVNK